ncbi:MAG: hypothetical protein AAFW84_21295 [Cyanobacteria bacterium J06635_15]
MKTMIYLVEQDTQDVDQETQGFVLSASEQEFLKHITAEGICLPDLVKALGKTVKTSPQRCAFWSVIVALKAKGFVKTETIGSFFDAQAA